MNEFTREVHQTAKTYREKTQIRASDAVAGQYAPYLGGTPGRVSRPNFTPTTVVQEIQTPRLLFPDEGDATASLPPPPPTPSLPSELSSSNSHSGQSDDKTLALQFFEDTGNQELIPTEVDFKGKTRKDQLVRFLITYVWSYVHIFGTSVPSADHLLAAAKSTGLYDPNYSKYFDPTVKQYMLEVDKSYRVKPAGNVEAKRIFSEMQTVTEDGFTYWKGSSKPGRKNTRLSNDDQIRIDDWVSKPVKIGSLDVRKLQPTQQAMFALWSLTKMLKIAPAVKPRLAFEYLIKKYTTISGDAKSFSKALSRPGNIKYFGKNAEVAYYLKEDGEKEVEKWIGGTIPESIADDTDDVDATDYEGENE